MEIPARTVRDKTIRLIYHTLLSYGVPTQLAQNNILLTGGLYHNLSNPTLADPKLFSYHYIRALAFSNKKKNGYVILEKLTVTCTYS